MYIEIRESKEHYMKGGQPNEVYIALSRWISSSGKIRSESISILAQIKTGEVIEVILDKAELDEIRCLLDLPA